MLPAGTLICGLAGTGKSHLIRALASRSGLPVYSLCGDDLVTSEPGAGLAHLIRFWEVVSKMAPCFVLLDDVHVLCPAEPSSSFQVWRWHECLRFYCSALTTYNYVDSPVSLMIDIIICYHQYVFRLLFIYYHSTAQRSLESVHVLYAPFQPIHVFALQRRTIHYILESMDKLRDSASPVSVLATTDSVASFYTALLSPGRVDTLIPLSLPQNHQRRAILMHASNGILQPGVYAVWGHTLGW